jgi:cobalt-zinc-cadmium efflux system outer membrane protein
MTWRLIAIFFVASTCFAQSYSTNDDAQLELYVNEALEKNPSAQEAFAQYRASLQRLPQVRSLPDPMLGATQYARRPETRVGSQITMLSFSQTFPWFGKLSDKEKVAAKEADAMREMYEARKAEIVHQVKLAYYDMGYLDRAIAITEEDQLLLEHYEKLAEARYAQGIGLQQAVVKLQADITRDRSRLEQLRRQRVNAEAALNALLNRPAESAIAEVDMRGRPEVEADFPSLYETARQRRPELQASLLQVERDEKRIQLARRNYWPDFTLGASFVNVGGRSDPAGLMSPPDQNGKNVYALTVGINIPIRRRKYDAAVLEATESKIASRRGYESTLNSVQASVRAVGFRIQTLKDQISLFQKTLVPQAELALRSTEAAYSTGTVGVLDLLDSERTLLDVRLGLAQLDSDYMKSLAEMERAIGAPFPEVTP